MRRVRIKDDALEQRMFFQRSLVAGALVTLVALLLAGRAFWLQVVQHEHYFELSQGNRARIEPLPPNRGIIYDRNGEVLAKNLATYSFFSFAESLPAPRFLAQSVFRGRLSERCRHLQRRIPHGGQPA